MRGRVWAYEDGTKKRAHKPKQAYVYVLVGRKVIEVPADEEFVIGEPVIVTVTRE